MDFLGALGDPDMAVNGAAFLRKAGHVENRAALAFEMRRHSEQRADCHHTGSANACDEDSVMLVDTRKNGLGQWRQLVFAEIACVPLLQRAAVYRDETRAEAFDAGIVLVAARLIDLSFAAEFGLDRHHRQAIGGVGAIAATFAHEIVDEDPLGGTGEAAALPAAPLLGGAGLIVYDRGDALGVPQIAFNRVEVVA